jgi:hypothetical protein
MDATNGVPLRIRLSRTCRGFVLVRVILFVCDGGESSKLCISNKPELAVRLQQTTRCYPIDQQRQELIFE